MSRNRKGQPNQVVLENSQENAFIVLKSSLMVTPVLTFPNLNESCVHADASDVGDWSRFVAIRRWNQETCCIR